MARFLKLLSLLVLIGALLLAYQYKHEIKQKFTSIMAERRDEKADLAQVNKLLEEKKYHEAFAIIKLWEGEISKKTASGRKWQDLYIQTADKSNNLPELIVIYEFDPSGFAPYEDAALKVGAAYLVTKRSTDFDNLRNSWKGKEKNVSKWFYLDADRLLVDDNKEGSINLLRSKSFEGKDDSPRLARLAVLTLNQNPKQAWEYLTEAAKKDPENSSLRIYRARFLEAVGKPTLALSEYLAAVYLDKEDNSARDQMADFFLRTRQYNLAMQVLATTLDTHPTDYLWFKTLYWNKIIAPIAFDWKSKPVPDGSFDPLITYLINLKPGTFWNEEQFEKLPAQKRYLQTLQETFWLKLLESLRRGDEKAALALLQNNQFRATSFNPDLEKFLIRALLYRTTGKFSSPSFDQALTILGTEKNLTTLTFNYPVFTQIEELAKSEKEGKKQEIPVDLQAVLKSKEVFAIANLTVGWMEAGLILDTPEVLSDKLPDWVAYGFALAIRQLKGDDAVLAFIQKQNSSPLLTLLKGETQVALGQKEEALTTLTPLLTDTTPVGTRATWIISLIYYDQKNFAKAKKIITANPRLNGTIQGKEALARIALMQNDTATATSIYNEIQAQSPEAQSFFARKAFQEKDWKKAREITENLVRQYPLNADLRKNLEVILEKEKEAEENVKQPLPAKGA